MELVKITELTEALTISSRSLRYYESIGLIESIRDDNQKYRLYDEKMVERVKQIIILRKLQIPIKDIQRIYRANDMSVFISVFTHKISMLDSDIHSLAELKKLTKELLRLLLDRNVNDLSQLPSIYDTAVDDELLTENSSFALESGEGGDSVLVRSTSSQLEANFVLKKNSTKITNKTILQAIAKQLNQDGLTEDDLLGIFELSINQQQLNDIGDLVYLRNLRKLELRQNGISNFLPLTELKELESLNIGNDPWNESAPRNLILNTAFLAKLPKLKFLDVSHTKINDVEFVRYLPELLQIEAMCNYVSDLDPLCACPGLRAMNFYSCRLWNIDVCKHLPLLEAISVNENGIRDLSPLSGCGNLKVLNVHSNKIGSIECISNLTELTYVTLDQNCLGNLSTLKNMPHIQHLTISLNPYLHDISVLKELPELKYCEAANLDLSPAQKEELQMMHADCHFVWSY